MWSYIFGTHAMPLLNLFIYFFWVTDYIYLRYSLHWNGQITGCYLLNLVTQGLWKLPGPLPGQPIIHLRYHARVLIKHTCNMPLLSTLKGPEHCCEMSSILTGYLKHPLYSVSDAQSDVCLMCWTGAYVCPVSPLYANNNFIIIIYILVLSCFPILDAKNMFSISNDCKQSI